MSNIWLPSSVRESDFTVKSAVDQTKFGVRRECLQQSAVFRDMFQFCDSGTESNGVDQYVELGESKDQLVLLLGILHEPPRPPVQTFEKPTEQSRFSSWFYKPEGPTYVEGSVIPLPLAFTLLRLADKYSLAEPIIDCLNAHIGANAKWHPLQVYGYATQIGDTTLVNSSSRYLMHPPVSSYTEDDIRVIATIEDYHKLVRLQALRALKLREILQGEMLFPHGYGRCDKHHQQAEKTWEQHKEQLIPRVESGTDVPIQMSSVLSTYQPCKTCDKAFTAALEMLAYKCRKAPRKIKHLLTTPQAQ